MGYDTSIMRSQVAGGAYTFATLPTATQMVCEPQGMLAYTTDKGLCYWTGSVWAVVSGTGSGSGSTLFYILGWTPATTGATDAAFTAMLPTMPNYWICTRLILMQSTATAQVASGTQSVQVWTGAAKTGSRLDNGLLTSTQCAIGAQYGFLEFSNFASAISNLTAVNTNTLYVSSATAVTGWTASAAFDIYCQGMVLPAGP